MLKEISSLLSDPVAALDEAAVRALAARLFKNNQHLHDAFLAIVPAANAAADHLLASVVTRLFSERLLNLKLSANPLQPEPEHIDLTEDGEDVGYEAAIATTVTNFDYEVIDLSSEVAAAVAEDDDLGGENCVCGCHPGPSKEAGRAHPVVSPHCLHCSIKFVNGRLYLRDGRNLRPAKAEVVRGGQLVAEGDRVTSGRSSVKKGKRSTGSVAMEVTH